jgi:predicted NBD/HSP70 family sugar kinase
VKRDTSALWDPGSQWEGIEDAVPSWIENVSWNLAFASINAVAVTDVSRVVIDGSVPEAIRDAILARTSQMVSELPTAGLESFVISAGTLGPMARAVGAASIPLHAGFAHDQTVLLK